MITLGILVVCLYLLAKYERVFKGGNLFPFLLMMNLLFIGIILWDLFGLDGGTGGSPYDLMEL